MAINGLAAGLLIFSTFCLICTFIMMIYLKKGKMEINSSYNYRPKWASVDLPGDVKTKLNHEATKWVLYDTSALCCALIIGCVFSIISGNNNALALIAIVCINLWILVIFAIIVRIYFKAWSLEKKYKASKA
jgi:hypothetical protein